MKVFFAASASNTPKYSNEYSIIRDTILKRGHQITRDWLPEVKKRLKKSRKIPSSHGWYQKVIKAIFKADVVIAEVSSRELSVGTQITTALYKRKPVLLLCKIGMKKPIFYLLQEIYPGLLLIKYYKETSEIPKAIEKFLEKYKKGKRVRLNLVIDSVENNYLEWAGLTYNKKKTEIIRSLIKKQIESDYAYQEDNKI